MALQIWTSNEIESCARCRERKAGVVLRDQRQRRDESSYVEFCFECWPKVTKRVEAEIEAHEQAKRAAECKNPLPPSEAH